MRHRLAIILPINLILYALCFTVAFLLRFDFEIPESYASLLWECLPVVLLLKVAVCLGTREWQRRLRYTTLEDALYVSAGAFLSAGLIFPLNLVLFTNPAIPRSVILIDVLLSILAAGLLRSGARMFFGSVYPRMINQDRKRTLIYGSDSSGVGILRALQATSPEHRVVGFIDSGDQKTKSLVAGVPVFSIGDDLHRIVQKLRADQLLVPGSLSGKVLRKLIESCQNLELTLHVIPAVQEIVAGRFKMSVRDVTISDLLRREPAQLDMQGIRDYVTGRCVLVTGAAGSIGSELCRQVLEFKPSTLVLVDQTESGIFEMEQELKSVVPAEITVDYLVADIRDQDAMDQIMDDFRPELVFHAAAYKHVPLMEKNPQEAIRNNILGTKNIVDLADKHGVDRFVLISTDKAVRPTSIMGATKLVAEKYLQVKSTKSSTHFVTVRFGNVLNSVGSVVPTFRKQIEAGGPVTVTHPDMERFFMTIPEAVQLVLQSGAIGATGDVLILDMGEPVKIVDLAKDLIYLSGLKAGEDIDIEFTGIRPGEKLYEELFYGSETGAKQVHDKIFCGTRNAIAYSTVVQDLAILKNSLEAHPTESANTLWTIISRYVASDDSTEDSVKIAA